MNEPSGKNQFGRRSFLQKTAGVGLGITSAALMSPHTLLAAEHHAVHTNFVGRSGTHFTLHGKPFYFVGTNNYYMQAASNYMIDDVFKRMLAMKLPVLRFFGHQDGPAYRGISLQPTLGSFPEAMYVQLDYTVAQASKLGIKLVITLVNNWDGMQQYVNWVGGTNHDEFYTNVEARAAYKNYVHNFIHRTNRFTGRKMRDEPAIMTWELGNEPRCQSDPGGTILLNWVKEMSAYIKSIDPNHLVAVGDEGFYNNAGSTDFTYNGGSGDDWKKFIAVPTIDYGTAHLYPDGWGKTEAWALQWIEDHLHDACAANKPMVLEEFGWLDMTTRDGVYQAWLDTLYRGGGNAQFWLLTGLQDDGTLYPNYDGFLVEYPSSTASLITAEEMKMRAKSR
ncbi:MAG: cellulase family glycosylhydrolase [Ktedonobacteraceae bacterium]|nr:cellulase family glycosylhydrolase [Ktedonobacteraceae bacterium]